MAQKMIEETYAIPGFTPSSLENWTSDDLLKARIPKEVMDAKLRLLKKEMMAAIRAKDVCSVQADLYCYSRCCDYEVGKKLNDYE